MAEYSDTVAQLLKLGDPWDDIPFDYDYLEMGFTAEHIPQLIQMATNPAAYRSEKTRHMWSVVHSWRVLAQLKAIEAIEPLLGMLEELPDVDYATELEGIFNAIGVKALPFIEKYIQQPHEDEFKALTAVDLATALGETYPDARAEAIRIITAKLSRFAENTLEINGLIIGNLLDLEATESIDIIRKAFQAKKVDPSLVGNLGDVEVFLGISEKPKRYEFDLDASEFVPEQMKMLGQLLKQLEGEGNEEEQDENSEYRPPRQKSNTNDEEEDFDLFGGSLDRSTKHMGSKKKPVSAKVKKDKRKQAQASQKKNRKKR